MAYRATPLTNGQSPAELLMGRKLRTTVPVLPSCLNPGWTDIAKLREREQRERGKQWRKFNSRHRARDLARLNPGDHVWITDMKEKGTVSARAETPWSYLVQTPRGLLRHNRSHLITVPESRAESADPPSPALQENINPVHVSAPPAPMPLNNHATKRRYPTRERNPPRYLKDFDLDRRYSRVSE